MNRARIALLLLLASILAVGLWSYKGIDDSLRAIRATGLQTLLGTQIETLSLWIAEGERQARQLAEDAQLRAALEELAAAGQAADGRSGRGAPDGRHIIDAMLREAAGSGAVAAHVVSPGGLILASSSAGHAGRQVAPDFLAHLGRVFAGGTAFVRPHRNRDAAPAGTGIADRPLAWIEAPVRTADGKVVAAIGLGYAADGQFADILKAARPGESGEALAFDAEGWLLSESRHADELKRRGLTGAEAGAVLAARLVVPLSAAEADDTPSLTRLASAAVSAGRSGSPVREGLLLDPYAGYLGHEVIGAWRWLAEHDMGIAVEMSADEAYAPLAYLRIAYAAALAIMMLIWLSVFLPRTVLERILRPARGPRQIGPYRLLRQIGEGAISNVYLARHNLLRRPAAIKVLKPLATTDEWIARFEREVQLASRLRHPNTITIYDYGTARDGLFYCAMEYLEGLSLGDLVEHYGPVPPARAAYILRQVCASLGEAHAQGLVHRDIKPQNIMLCEINGVRDMVKVLDFGLVKQVSGSHTRDLTGTLRILGTPLYMSPERIRNPSDADARADIYALGAVAFYLLTGKRLFETETDHDLTYQVLHVTPRRASGCAAAAVPAALDDLIARCLEKDPAARPQSVAEVAEVLDGVLALSPWTARQIDAWWKRHWVSPDHPERRFSVEPAE